MLNPGNPPTLTPETARAWVHPSDGVDPTSPGQRLGYINEPSLKFRTVNAAIDAVHEYLTVNHDATENPDQHGVVYALPGVYSSTSNGEVLPIVMRDRVHVQGVGARRCVIRGGSRAGLPSTNRDVLWPTQADWGSIPNVEYFRQVEVLVEYLASTPDQAGPGHPSDEAPWGPSSSLFYGDTPEVFDGFTLQGGDVQVLLRDPPAGVDYFPAQRVSNCVFDLRDGMVLPESAVVLTGPYIGLMMVRHATYQPFGANSLVSYMDGRTLIAHNTFIFARWTGAASNDGFSSFSRAQTVGVMDVTNPSCGLTAADADDRFRGMGSPCLVGNLFRTRPQSGATRPYAMLGIADDDTRVFDGLAPGGAWRQTNAFDPARVGSTNGYFHSIPVTSSQLHAGSSFA